MWLSAALKNGSPENIVSCYTLIDMGSEVKSKIEIIFFIHKFKIHFACTNFNRVAEDTGLTLAQNLC